MSLFQSDEFSSLIEITISAVINKDVRLYRKRLTEIANLTKKLTSRSMTSLFEAGSKYIELNQYMEGLSCLQVITKVFIGFNQISEIHLDIIVTSVEKITRAMKELLGQSYKMRDTAMQFIIPGIKDMISDLDYMKISNCRLKTERKAYCYNHLSRAYFQLKLFDEGVKVAKDALRLMRNEFPDTYKHYKILSFIKITLGEAYRDAKNETEALKWFQGARSSLKESRDWKNLQEKHDAIMALKKT